MQVEAIALTSFVHGDIYARQGKIVKKPDGSLLDYGVANDLELAGLVRIVPRRVDQALSLGASAEMVAGNASAAGQDQPSPSLPAAPASLSGTLHLPKHGRSHPQKTDT